MLDKKPELNQDALEQIQDKMQGELSGSSEAHTADQPKNADIGEVDIATQVAALFDEGKVEPSEQGPDEEEKTAQETEDAGQTEKEATEESSEQKSGEEEKAQETGDAEQTDSPIWMGALWIVLCGIAALVVRTVSWAFQNFGNLRMDEMVYTLTADLKGTNPALIQDAIVYILPWVISAMALGAALLWALRNERRITKWVLRGGSLLALLVILASLVYFSNRIGFVDYIRNQNTESAFIEEHYVDPSEVKMTFPEKKRNLIYIFLESMEISYADEEHGGGKKENLIPELTQIALENEDFSGESDELNGAYSLYGSTYTMAGLFAQTCGIPLNASASELGETEGFFPGATALGDILEDAGYHNVFFIGTDAAFSGRIDYFKTHGNYEILDYNYAVENHEIPEDYSRAWWGFEDSILFENAKKHVTELAQRDEPFNFTMLTVDTHAQDGYLCELCPNNHPDDPYADVFSCSSKLTAEFIRWIQEQDFYEDTTIVVAGDHCSMDSDFCDDMDPDYERKIYSVYINPAAELQTQERREMCSMDNYPTTLAALGVDIKGDKLGLGVNAFSKTKTLLEVYGKDELTGLISQKSTFLKDMLGEKNAVREVSARYDDQSGKLQVRVAKPLIYSAEFDKVICDIQNKETKDKVRADLEETEEDYRADIALDEVGYQEGEYSVKIMIVLKDGLGDEYKSLTVTLDQLQYEPREISSELDQEGGILTVRYKPASDDGETDLMLAVWSEENGQDDMRWYPMEPVDGIYEAKITCANHTKDGQVNLHVYEKANEPTVFKKSAMAEIHLD